MRVIPAESINRYADSDLENFINSSEEEYGYQLQYSVNGIIRSLSEKSIILINGPSGSGKTVSSHRIRQMLEKKGYRTHIISMDNYFLPIKDCRNDCDENGNVDLESPKRLDIDLLNKQLDMILKCEEIIIPSFHFPTQTRNDGEVLRRNAEDIVIMEGIHAFNPLVTGSVLSRASKIYVSVRTRIKAERLLHPSRIRLMRRLVRDSLFRGRLPSETIKNFRNVERGEKLYIMPFKNSADYDIDTFLPFEPCVYKNLLEKSLNNVDTGDRYVLNEIAEINYFLGKLRGIDEKHIPARSLIREFIGGHELM